MSNPLQKFMDYRRERRFIRDQLRLGSDNFW